MAPPYSPAFTCKLTWVQAWVQAPLLPPACLKARQAFPLYRQLFHLPLLLLLLALLALLPLQAQEQPLQLAAGSTTARDKDNWIYCTCTPY